MTHPFRIKKRSKSISDASELSSSLSEKQENENKNLNVSELCCIIQKSVKNNLNDTFTVTGELSNFRINKNNLYAKLKDNNSSLSVKFWKFTNNVKEKYDNGDKVIVSGIIDFYSPFGEISFIINKIQKNGIGDLHKNYEKIKQQYKELGYFDDSRKKTYPKSIRKIGIVTSSDGAAITDVKFVLDKYGFKGNIIIKGCAVQGFECGKSIAKAIKILDNMNLDIILITRGGGSLEDLMGFSDSNVLEAIYLCNTYTISAVGHEIDSMLSDFVADQRSPTPSIGAEYICGLQKDEFNKLDNYLDKLTVIFNEKNKIVDNLKMEIYNIKSKLISPINFINEINLHLDSFNKMVIDLIKNKFTKLFTSLEILKNKLLSKDITHILKLGFVVMTDIETGNIVKTIEQLEINRNIKIMTSTGDIEVYIKPKKDENKINPK
jgi:exodeoxyribonuclease VII large subunit